MASATEMSRANPIRAVVFDMDGILVDTEPLWRQVREEFAAEHGLSWTRADQETAMGRNTRGWSQLMVERLQLQERLGLDADGIAAEIKGRLVARYRQQLPRRAGGIEAVHLAATRYRVALATGSPPELAEHILAATGLDRVFVATMYGDDVPNGKPAPDIWLAALAKLGVPPEQAVGVEDSANGVLSLRAAGMGVIAAPGADFPLGPELLALADVRIRAMTEFSLARVEEAGAARRVRAGS